MTDFIRPPTGVVPQDYERAVLSRVEALLSEENTDKPEQFVFKRIDLLESYPSTRLVVEFDWAGPRVRRSAYWAALWETVAWYEYHAVASSPSIHSQPERFASEFVFNMYVDLGYPAEHNDDPPLPGFARAVDWWVLSVVVW